MFKKNKKIRNQQYCPLCPLYPKTLEDLTIKELRELKVQYKEDFIKLLNNFFETHPGIYAINIHSKHTNYLEGCIYPDQLFNIILKVNV